MWFGGNGNRFLYSTLTSIRIFIGNNGIDFLRIRFRNSCRYLGGILRYRFVCIGSNRCGSDFFCYCFLCCNPLFYHLFLNCLLFCRLLNNVCTFIGSGNRCILFGIQRLFCFLISSHKSRSHGTQPVSSVD